MKQVETVRVGTAEFLVEVAETRGGVQPVGAQEAFSLDGVRDTIEAVASQVAEVWKKVKPDEASVEFGLSIAVKSGKLTGLLVDGAGAASLKVTLTWKSPTGRGDGPGDGDGPGEADGEGGDDEDTAQDAAEEAVGDDAG